MPDAANACPQIGQGDYTVKPGDCMESIAFTHGFFWQTLWSLPENAALNQGREPHVLLPGDRVTIPPLRKREDPAATDIRHKYVKLGATCTFKLRFLDEKQQPRAGLDYILTIDGKNSTGALDAQGSLTVSIKPNASQGSIQLQTDPDPETYQLDLGHLDPNLSATGVRGRLSNLGYSCSPTGDWDDALRAAVQSFQTDNHLPVTGQVDDATKQALTQTHQS